MAVGHPTRRAAPLAACALLALGALLAWGAAAAAQEAIPFPKLELGLTTATKRSDVSTSLQVLALLTVLSLAPSILIMATSFTRIVIVLSFVRRALATQQLPSNQTLIGLALIMTFYVMAPVFTAAYNDGVKPYLEERLGVQESLRRTLEPFRLFMFKQVRPKDLELFIRMAGDRRPNNRDEVPTHVLVPAFVLSELKLSFEMGVIVFLPFLVIDMVIASTLMSMGMIMLPTVMISLPFKILVFVLADGWHLVVQTLVTSFRR